MSEIAFESFGKVPRLFRDVVITEKIDGTNAAIGIVPFYSQDAPTPSFVKTVYGNPTGMGIREAEYVIYAQSRKRIITPTEDNAGFAKWVYDNADTLVTDLGPGLHFGEWWGSGIQRGYGLPKGEKRFSLFNTGRWAEAEFTTPNLGCVPVLYEGPFSSGRVKYVLYRLKRDGSSAVEFDRPEGVVVYHSAGRMLFKATIENDEKPKGSNE